MADRYLVCPTDADAASAVTPITLQPRNSERAQ
jgi:hypothetical protein